MINIICHIVGMNSMMKKDFNEFIKNYSNIVISDLDTISNQIHNSKKMIELNRKKNKRNINQYWKEIFTKKINNVIKKYKKYMIIFIGLNINHKNIRLKVPIDTKNNFFIKINHKKNARDIIEFNLNKYKQHIIRGIFPLKLLDHNHLIKQRSKLENTYSKLKYKSKSYNSVQKWIELKFDKKQKGGDIKIKLNNIYVGSSKRYYNHIKYSKRRKIMNKILGYKAEWMALLSIIPNLSQYIKKGYLRYKNQIRPYIEEKSVDAFNILNKQCYLYKVDTKNFKKINWYKYYTIPPLKIDKTIVIENIIDYLKDSSVKLIKYKK